MNVRTLDLLRSPPQKTSNLKNRPQISKPQIGGLPGNIDRRRREDFEISKPQMRRSETRRRGEKPTAAAFFKGFEI
jgi:hypothetical protein